MQIEDLDQPVYQILLILILDSCSPHYKVSSGARLFEASLA